MVLANPRYNPKHHTQKEHNLENSNHAEGQFLHFVVHALSARAHPELIYRLFTINS